MSISEVYWSRICKRVQWMGQLTTASMFFCSSIWAADAVMVGDTPYWHTVEIKCRVKKAVPAPEKGSTWYSSSPIGDVWFKFDPSTQPSAKQTNGVIRIYETSPVYTDLVVYSRAWLNENDEEYEGSGDRLLPVDPDTYDSPLYFNIDKVERQGLFHGKDGKPKYFLSSCRILPALAQFEGELLEKFAQQKNKREN